MRKITSASHVNNQKSQGEITTFNEDDIATSPAFVIMLAIMSAITKTRMQLKPDTAKFVDDFIRKEQLPASYKNNVSRFFGRVAQRIIAMVRQHNSVPVIGINGAQGTGKSTFSGCVAGLLRQQGLRVLVLSIDDLYFPRAEREQLSTDIHPLFITRGVPGTHDMALGHKILQAAKGKSDPNVPVPRFDKSSDDRSPDDMPFPKDGVDVVLFEGWCIGARPQPKDALNSPINALERDHDATGVWRNYVNEALAGIYADVFAEIDYLLMLKPPSFEAVYRWRGEQEDKLKQRLKEGGITGSRAMNETELNWFISHYERLTRWMLEEMPQRADDVFEIGDDHQVTRRIANSALPGSDMISTDLDATLLDETYRWESARPALERLAQQNAVVVLNSSKTVSEMLHLARELKAQCGLRAAPIVAENGGVLALPDENEASGYRYQCLGIDRQFILKQAHRLRKTFGYKFDGFADMTAETLIQHTGLTFEAAQMAMDRLATEPILWHGNDTQWQAFTDALKPDGIRAVRGGRFIHLMGDADKADGLHAALKWCVSQNPGRLWRVIALGDSPNDRDMLDAADIAVAIPNPAHQLSLQPSALYNVFPLHPGPKGWNEAILSILDPN